MPTHPRDVHVSTPRTRECSEWYLIWKMDLRRCYEDKDDEMRSFWIIQVGPTPNDKRSDSRRHRKATKTEEEATWPRRQRGK